MPTDVAGIPLLPLIALVLGFSAFIFKNSLEYIVGLFLIGFGVLGLLPLAGIEVSGFEEQLKVLIREVVAEMEQTTQ